jgi:hypothetical protein
MIRKRPDSIPRLPQLGEVDVGKRGTGSGCQVIPAATPTRSTLKLSHSRIPILAVTAMVKPATACSHLSRVAGFEREPVPQVESNRLAQCDLGL